MKLAPHMAAAFVIFSDSLLMFPSIIRPPGVFAVISVKFLNNCADYVWAATSTNIIQPTE